MKAIIKFFPVAFYCAVLATMSQVVRANNPSIDAPLVEAAKTGAVPRALALIKEGADVNQTASDGATALHWAVHFDQQELVERLLRGGANVEAKNDYGATPLSEAAVVGNQDVIEKLIAAGVDVNAPNADGQTALMVVARTANVEVAKLLLRSGADVNAREQWREQTALMWAAAQSQPAMMKLLIDAGADIDARSTAHKWQRQVTAESRAIYRPAGGFTPMLFAARQGCLECARVLVKAGANVNLTDPERVSPMLMAVLNAHFDVAAYLLKQGADPNLWDWWGRTPLYAAVDYNTVPMGGRPDMQPLDMTNSLQLIELLLQAGANPNAQLKLFPPYRSMADRGGDRILTIGATPLLRAAKAGDTAAVKLLLQHGALVDLPNDMGITPMMAASGLGATPVDTRGKLKTETQALQTVGLLIDAGADVNATDNSGQTALHGAAYWGMTSLVQLLADNRAQLTLADQQGITPMDSAMGVTSGNQRGALLIEAHSDTVDLLRALISAKGAESPMR